VTYEHRATHSEADRGTDPRRARHTQKLFGWFGLNHARVRLRVLVQKGSVNRLDPYVSCGASRSMSERKTVSSVTLPFRD
jgi:hypothetical protein